MPVDEDPRDDERDARETRRRRDEGDEYDERPRRRQERDDYDDRPRRHSSGPEVEATDFLIPTNVSAWSMAACYFGLFSCFIPFIGLVMALVAFPCGIVALRRRKKKAASYGSVTGDIRAVIGLICSSLTLIGHLIMIVAIASN
jgi:hypothetical protein